MTAVRTAVVHLASGSLGVETLRRFLDSYRANDAGLEHDLVVVLNRIEEPGSAEPLRATLAGVPHREIALDEPLIDLAAYVRVAPLVDADRLCLLNATSEVLAPGWLAHLSAALDLPGVGVAGATGNFESHVRGALGAGDLGRGAAQDVVTRLRRVAGAARLLPFYPAFPNPHLRTTGLLLDRADLLRVRPPDLATKSGAHRFESGRQSLTRQLTRGGRRPVVVGRDGSVHEVPDWPASRTFRSGEQEHLLIADRRTREWATASAAERRELQALSWGQGT